MLTTFTSFLSRFQLISFMFVGITICQPSSTRGLNICFNLWLPTFSSLFSLPGGGRNCGVHELICARRGKAISHPCTCASVSIRVHFFGVFVFSRQLLYTTCTLGRTPLHHFESTEDLLHLNIQPKLSSSSLSSWIFTVVLCVENVSVWTSEKT